jgi:urea transporter
MTATQAILINKGWKGRRPEFFVLLYIDVVLRGIAQVFLCNHPSWELMLYALLATAVATTSAATLGRLPEADIFAGLCGYDGALVGCACWAFSSIPVLAGLVHVAFVNLLRTWQLPCFTFVFNVVTIMFLYTASSNSILLNLSTSSPVAHDSHRNEMSIKYVVDASIRGVGQFMFADTTVGSASVVAGICISSRKGALVAVIGATTGWIMARYVLHATLEDSIRAGLYGYNCAGTCCALSGGISTKLPMEPC